MIRTCTHCGQKNRVAPAHLADTGRCGACKADLPAIDEPIPVTGQEFDDIVANAKVPVLVDFWAAWCGPCRSAAPEVAKTAKQMAGRAVVLKVDTQQEQTLAARYKVQGIPNFMVFANGKPVRQQAGLVGAEVMSNWLQQATTT